MLNKIFYNLIKLIVYLVKYFKLDRFFFDKIIFNVGLKQLIENKKHYNEFTCLQQADLKIFSQNGEDGIIDYILYKLDIVSPNFVEIGVGNYRESNTRFLYNKIHPKGLIIDCENNLKEKVKPYVNLWKGELKIHQDVITSVNINEILNSHCDFNIDLFSIDIDSVDYWIISKLKSNISKIFVAEFNPIFGPDLEVTVPNIDGFNRNKYHYSNLCYGMSLRALIKLMDKKNYYFLGTNLQKMNAFFISKDFAKENFFSKIKIKDYSEYTNSNIRDSRDKKNNLNYLSGSEKIKEIENCEVVNLKDNVHKIGKLKNLL